MGANNLFLRFGPLAFLMIALTIFSRPALAAPILNVGPNGELNGISAVPIRGSDVLYDIQFKTGSFEEVFGSKGSFRANEESPHYEYSMAMSHVLGNLFTRGPAEAYLYEPHLIDGCEGWGCRIYTPYAQRVRDDESSHVHLFEPPSVHGQPAIVGQTPDARHSWGERGPNEVWAVFSYTSADVPGPSSLALFAIGAFGLLFRHRRFGRTVLK